MSTPEQMAAEARAAVAQHRADTLATETERFAQAVERARQGLGVGEEFNLSRPGTTPQNGDLMVTVGGPEHGLSMYRVVAPPKPKKGEPADPEAQPSVFLDPISPVVAWRSSVQRTLGAVEDGARRKTAEVWTVKVQGGPLSNRPFAIEEIGALTPEESLTFKKVFEKADVFIGDLADRGSQAAFATMLKNLAVRNRATTERFGTLGFHEVEGEGAWYASVNASVRPDGVLSTERVCAEEAVSQYGLAEVVPTGTELREVASCIAGFPSIIDSNRTFIPLAMLGTVFASPLNVPLSTVSLVAKKGRGKTAMGACAMAFVAPQTAEGAETWSLTDESSTLAGASMVFSFARNVVCMTDDLKRFPEDAQANARIKKMATQISTWAYGGSKGIKGVSGGGGARVSGEKRFGNIETGEERLEDASRLSRYVLLPELTDEDIVPASRRPSGSIAPVDWLNQHRGMPGKDGSAARFYTAFVAWLTRSANTPGSWVLNGEAPGVGGLTRAATARREAKKRDLNQRGVGGADGRAAVGVSGIWTGLDYLRAFMVEEGIDDLLVPEVEVEEQMVLLAGLCSGEHADGAFDETLLRFIARHIESKDAYIEAPDPALCPVGVHLDAGWTPNGPKTSAIAVGRFSNDFRTVVLKRGALEVLMKKHGLLAGPKQTSEALVSLVPAEHRVPTLGDKPSGVKVSASVCETRPVGYAVETLRLVSATGPELDSAAEVWATGKEQRANHAEAF